MGLRAMRPLHRIPLTIQHRHRRKEWAALHRQWLPGMWNQVLWTDESRFTLDFADGRVKVRRMQNERYADACIMERDRFGGGSIMVWGGIWYGGRTACAYGSKAISTPKGTSTTLSCHTLYRQ